MAAAATKDLQALLDRYDTGIVVTGLNFQNLRPPQKVQAAFDDAIAAREDNQRYKNQAEAYASKVVPEARGQAARIRTEAEGAKQAAIAKATGDAKRFELLVAEYQKAPAVTRERLYLETLESVYKSSRKVVIDQKAGNGSMIYLPLDKIIERSRESDSSTVTVRPPVNVDSDSSGSTDTRARVER